MSRPVAVRPDYTRAERRADAVVHVAGLAFAVVACVILFVGVFPTADGLHRVAISIYGAGLITMLGCSALYNLSAPGERKALYRRLDHAAIFLMIAGTYTPFLLLAVGGTWGVGLLVFVWLVAIAGAAVKLVFPGRFERASICAYLLLGWSVLAALDPVLAAVSPSAVTLLAIGGALYSIGVIFHVWERLPFQNAIWHAFVLAAAACHYAAVLVVRC